MIATKPLNFEAWKETVPLSIRNDPLWKLGGYQKALFLYHLTWSDCELLMQDVRGKAIAAQLIRSAGSISANLEEGFGRGFGRDYAHFQIIALGSARETRGWYHRANELLSGEVCQHRITLLDEIIGMLVNASQYQRKLAASKVQGAKQK